MTQSRNLIETLKSILKNQGITYKDIAKHLKITEAGVKKALNSEKLTLDRVEKIGMLVGLSLLDILKLSDATNNQKQLELNLEQESILASDERLFVGYHFVLSGYSFDQVIENFNFSEIELEQLWQKLESIGLLKMLKPRQVVLKSVLNPVWIENGPLFKVYGAKLAQEFVIEQPEEGRGYKRFLRGGMSDQVLELMVAKMKQIELEFANYTMQAAPTGNNTVALYHSIRPWKFSVVEKYRKNKKNKDPSV